jgi:hypothetical protein
MLYQRLYNMVWLASFSFVVTPHLLGKYSAPFHAALGIAMLVLPRRNAKELAKLAVPDRLKRISQAVVMTTTMLAVVGVLFGALKHIPGMPEVLATTGASILGGFHVFIALAVLAQSSSLATGYDMWEEKEIGPTPAAAPSAPSAPPAGTPPPAAS